MTTTLAPLDQAMYDDLVAFATAMRTETGPADPSLHAVAQAVLVREARLLDDRSYTAWLDLLTDDCVYWVPSSSPIEDPREKVSYLLDDRRRIEDRVALLDTGWAHAQIPPSRTQRLIGGVEAWAEGADHLRVRASAVVWDWRKEHLVHHPAVLLYRLRRAGDSGDWAIALRVVHRVDADRHVGNVAYIL